MDAIDVVVEVDDRDTDEILARAAAFDSDQLDRPMEPDPGLVAVFAPTLRSLLETMVLAREVWATGMAGVGGPVDRPDSPGALQLRWQRAQHTFRETVSRIKVDSAWDEVFIRVTWAEPAIFTFGGAIAHTLQFSAIRRELARRMIRTLEGGSL